MTTTMENHPCQIWYHGTCQMSMSRFRLALKIGLLERMKRLYGYLSKTNDYTIRYRTKEPDYSHIPKQEYEWSMTVYGNVKEEIPKDIPKPFEKG